MILLFCGVLVDERVIDLKVHNDILYRKEGDSSYRNCDAASVGKQYTKILVLSIRSDKGLTLETSAFRISVRWPIYIINSVDKTKIFVYCIGKSHKVQYDVQYE